MLIKDNHQQLIQSSQRNLPTPLLNILHALSSLFKIHNLIHHY